MLVPVATIWLEEQMVPSGYPQKEDQVKMEALVNLKQFDVFQCIVRLPLPIYRISEREPSVFRLCHTCLNV